jgi:hypothetical protein
MLGSARNSMAQKRVRRAEQASAFLRPPPPAMASAGRRRAPGGDLKRE